mmetsp:Transcript_10713/g.17985  ORF Transcript_10713/g.17985 Transcript_10713/m.17985 type:complete len:229 (+) Transcript_10713:1679-2365(+)
MDELYQGKDFDPQIRLAQNLSFVTSVFMFSAAIPDLLVVLPIYFFFHYWLDKWQISRICKMPHRFGVELNERAVNLLGIGLMLKILASMWILTTPEIFPSEILTSTASNGIKYYYMKLLPTSERFVNSSLSYHTLLLIIMFGVFFIIEPIALEIAKACCFKKPRRGQRTRKGTLRMYSIESLYHTKQASEFFYDLMKVNKYRRALLLLNNQDIDEADDFAVKQNEQID